MFTEAPAIFVAVAFAFALLIGSFLNVVIFRLPIMMQREWRDQCVELEEALPSDLPEGKFNLVVPRSRCPSCGQLIKAWQNIPVLSYLLLSARCANCRKSIPASWVNSKPAPLAFLSHCPTSFPVGAQMKAMVFQYSLGKRRAV